MLAFSNPFALQTTVTIDVSTPVATSCGVAGFTLIAVSAGSNSLRRKGKAKKQNEGHKMI
jgi:hypothetical protein